MSTNDENLELPEVDAEIEIDLGDAHNDALEEEEEREYRRVEELYQQRRTQLVGADTMAKRHYPAQSFLIGPDLLPKSGRMLITAENGTGKSALALYISACLATGTSLFGLKKRKHDETFGQPVFPVISRSFVTYVDYEIPEHIRQLKRLGPLRKNFSKDFLANLAFVKRASDYRLENERNAKAGEGSYDRLLRIVELTQPDVLVIDPFSSSHSLDENSSQIKQALNNIDRLIDHSGCAVILIHHASTKVLRDGKGQTVEKNAKEKARGHSAMTDWPDVHVQVDETFAWGARSAKAGKLLQLTFGKSRFSAKPHPKTIVADIENMVFEDAEMESPL